MSKLTGEKDSKCEAQLKHLLKSNQVIGSYSDYNQVFISKDTELFCQVHSGKFISSLPHHTCPSCGRNICCNCIGQLMDVGLVACVYCDTEFDPRPLIEVLISSDNKKLRNYGKGLNSMDVRNFDNNIFYPFLIYPIKGLISSLYSYVFCPTIFKRKKEAIINCFVFVCPPESPPFDISC